LMEEAERQKAQLARRAFRKGKEEHDEALGITDGSRPRKGNCKRRARITCWNCKKKGHYSNECEEPKEDDKSRGTGTAAGAESDSDSDFAWVVEENEGEDWFEEAVAVTNKESHDWDWFDEVDEGEEESDDEGGNSGGAVVDVFDRNAVPGGPIVNMEMEGTIFEDSGITGHIWPVHDDKNEFEGADRLSGAPTTSFEGEYEGEIASESSGRMPDLDFFENPWIGSPMMEWCNHAIAEQTDEINTRPPDNHKEGEDNPVAKTNEAYGTETSWPSKVIDAPAIDHVICEVNPSVPRFEGEEDIRVETMDLHIVHTTSAQNEPPTAKIFNPPDFAPKTMHENVVESSPSIVNPTVDCAKFFEAEKGQENVVDTHGGVELPMVVVAAEIVMDIHGGVGLPMVGVGQLVRPPECVSKEDGCCRGLSLLCFLLIAFDECHVTIMSRRNWSRGGVLELSRQIRHETYSRDAVGISFCL